MTAATSPIMRPGRDFEAPKLWWNPSISPGGLIIYSGDLFPQWKGDAIFGALSGEALVRADLDGDSARKADQWPMGARIREVEQIDFAARALLDLADARAHRPIGRPCALCRRRCRRGPAPRPTGRRTSASPFHCGNRSPE